MNKIATTRTLLIVGIGALAPIWWMQNVSQVILRISGLMDAQKSDAASTLGIYLFMALIVGLAVGLLMALVSKMRPLEMVLVFVASWLAAKALLVSPESASWIFNDLASWALLIGISCSASLYQRLSKKRN